MHVLPLTAAELEQKLQKLTELDFSLKTPSVVENRNIQVFVDYTIKDGSEIKFRSPVNCSEVTGLTMHYKDENNVDASMLFAFADANGNNIGDIDHLFAENVIVKVILDTDTALAFVQNPDTNAYLEGQFEQLRQHFDAKLTDKQNILVGTEGQVIVIDSTGKAVASDLNLITTDEIDAICGTTIETVSADEAIF